ncbi:MAG: META domain-containing protein [Muribaculaceae bacterium]|nr:META domain-containing protein [Muribaculaceae bacterium]MDE6551553.1 META domain-containing protein [Muribaculaceae bacterium]
MNTRFMTACFTVALMASCAGNKGTVDNDSAAVNDIASKTPVELNGQWYIENIFFNDSDYVRPAEILPDIRQYVQFTDSTYSIMTNCNSISGYYTISGDSITLGDGMMTEMACDNMQTEDALRRILPDIATIDAENDSIVRLNCRNHSGYIILKKNTAYDVK